MFISFKKLKGGRSAGDYYLTRSVKEEVAELSWWDPNSRFMTHEGDVDPSQFRDLLDGRLLLNSSTDGPELVRNSGSKNRIAGYDITFSAPKSVSVLMAAAELSGDQKLLQDLDAACRFACDEGLEFLVRHGAFRVGLNSGVTAPAEDIVVARVGHRTSRNGDPQTHYHNVVVNLGGRTLDGRLKTNALESSAILSKIEAAQEHSYAALAGRLVDLGFQVRRTETAIEIDGVDHSLCEAMSSRRTGAKHAAKIRGYENPTPAQLERMIWETRKPKSETTLDERYQEWLTKFADQQIEPDAVVKAAREIGQKRAVQYVYDPFTGVTTVYDDQGKGFEIHDPFFEASVKTQELEPSPSPQQQVPANVRDDLLREIREKLETGHSTISYPEALKAAASVARGRLDAEGSKALLEDALHSGGGVIPVVGRYGQNVRDKEGELIFTTPELRDAERRLLANSLGRANEKDWIPNRIRTLEKVIRKNEAEVGFKYSDEQRNALEAATGRSGVCVLEGSAGAGKSTVMRVAKDIYEGAGYNVTGLTPSWRSVEALRGSAGIQVACAIQGYALRLAKGSVKLTDKDVLIVDEAGMAGTLLLDTVLHHAKEAGAKVILTGDTRQLSAVDAGAPMESMVRLGHQVGMDVFRIAEVRRHSIAWQREATEAMSRGDMTSAIREYDRKGHIIRHYGEDPAKHAVLNDCRKALESGGAHLAVTARNKDVLDLNESLRPIYREMGRITGEEFELKITGRDKKDHTIQVAAGDRLLFGEKTPLKAVSGEPSNIDPQTGLPFIARSQIAIIEKVSETPKGLKMILRVEGAGADGGAVIFEATEEQLCAGRREKDRKALPMVQHGYALTVHASQGETVTTGRGKDGLVSVYNNGGFEAATTLVAMSRHTQDVRMHVNTRRLYKGDGRALAEERMMDEMTRDGRNKNIVSHMRDKDAIDWAMIFKDLGVEVPSASRIERVTSKADPRDIKEPKPRREKFTHDAGRPDSHEQVKAKNDAIEREARERYQRIVEKNRERRRMERAEERDMRQAARREKEMEKEKPSISR